MWTSNLDKVLDQVTGADCQQAAEELERYLDAELTATRESGLKGFRRAAARAIFSQARVDGFAFDVETLWLAHRLGLEVAEVDVQAMDRQGSKARMRTDALRMLGEVWTVRQAALDGAYSSRPQVPIAQPTATAVLADPLLPAPPTTLAF